MGGKGKQIELKDASFIHLLDTGSQPSFQDVLSLLLDVPCTYIQVFNAAHSLDEQVPITYRTDDHTRVHLEDAERGRDMMQRSFSSMLTMAKKCSKQLASFQQEQSPLPKLHIFGTGKPFFLIDTMADEDDRASVNHLRKNLSSKESSLKLDVPVVWFFCQVITRCTPKKFFRLHDLETFCQELWRVYPCQICMLDVKFSSIQLGIASPSPPRLSCEATATWLNWLWGLCVPAVRWTYLTLLYVRKRETPLTVV